MSGPHVKWRSIHDLPPLGDEEDEWDERCVVVWRDAENPSDEGIELTTLFAIRDGDFACERYSNPVWRTLMDAPIFD